MIIARHCNFRSSFLIIRREYRVSIRFPRYIFISRSLTETTGSRFTSVLSALRNGAMSSGKDATNDCLQTQINGDDTFGARETPRKYPISTSSSDDTDAHVANTPCDAPLRRFLDHEVRTAVYPKRYLAARSARLNQARMAG